MRIAPVLMLCLVLGASSSQQVAGVRKGRKIGEPYGYSSVLIPDRNPCQLYETWILPRALMGDRFNPPKYDQKVDRRIVWNYEIVVETPAALDCHSGARVDFFLAVGMRRTAPRFFDIQWSGSLYAAMFLEPTTIVPMVLDPLAAEGTYHYVVDVPLTYVEYRVYHQVFAVVTDPLGTFALMTSNGIAIDVPGERVPE